VKDGAGLGDAYGATLERIRTQGGEKTKLAMATLMWICHAERPLQVDELRHALAVEIGATDFDSENAPSIGVLLSCCQGLITVDKEASTVRFIHFTAQDYLCAHPDLFSHPHSVIAEVCLTYLNSPQVGNLPSRPVSGHQIMPFLKYSSRYWGTHANKGLSSHAVALGLQLLSQYEGHPSAVSLCEQVLPTKYTAGTGSSSHFSGLHCASFFGIVELVALLTNALGGEINLGDCAGYTPLLWAAKNGHDGVAKLLLEHEDIDPNKPNNCGSAPLLWAANNGHEGVVKLLLSRKDVDPNRLGHDGQTPLYSAAWAGHGGVVKILLGHNDINPDKPDVYGQTPLFGAASNGHETVVEVLLGREDVNPNKPDNRGRTPLYCASRTGHEGVVKILLDHNDIDPDKPDVHGQTPLFGAASNGHERVVEVLLRRDDVDPDKPNKNGQTPLFGAAWDGHEGVTKILLGHEDVSPNRSDKSDRTPLWWAAKSGHASVVALLQPLASTTSRAP